MVATTTPGRTPVPLLWRALMALARCGCALVGRMRVTGGIPDDLRGRPIILASNHIGNFDPVALAAALHTVGVAPRLLATAGLFRAPVLGPILRACGHIRVQRGSASAAEALGDAEAALAAGAVIAIYPEGRIGLDPEMWPERGKTGVGRLALRTRATVVPVAQWGAHEVLAYHGAAAMVASVLRAVMRRPVLRVHIGAPVALADVSVDQPGSAHRATERIMEAITAELVPLRRDEPRAPRRLDRTRPTSTGRSRRVPVPPPSSPAA
jgi:1-acyl-sn-glycerol-3-phosphate acyltransferase